MPKGSNTGFPTFSKKGHRIGSCGGCKQMNPKIKTSEKQQTPLTWKCDNCGTVNTWDPPIKIARINGDGKKVSGWNFGPREALWTAEEVEK